MKDKGVKIELEEKLKLMEAVYGVAIIEVKERDDIQEIKIRDPRKVNIIPTDNLVENHE